MTTAQKGEREEAKDHVIIVVRRTTKKVELFARDGIHLMTKTAAIRRVEQWSRDYPSFSYTPARVTL